MLISVTWVLAPLLQEALPGAPHPHTLLYCSLGFQEARGGHSSGEKMGEQDSGFFGVQNWAFSSRSWFPSSSPLFSRRGSLSHPCFSVFFSLLFSSCLIPFLPHSLLPSISSFPSFTPALFHGRFEATFAFSPPPDCWALRPARGLLTGLRSAVPALGAVGLPLG